MSSALLTVTQSINWFTSRADKAVSFQTVKIPTTRQSAHRRLSPQQGHCHSNSAMLGCFVPCHGCIDNAIHSAAGIGLRLECFRIMEKQKTEEPTGKAKITKAYNLPCRYVLHTVGPIIHGTVTVKDQNLLSDCYRSCLELAAAYHLKSVAFCCISTGEFHFPNEKAAEIAIQTVQDYQKENQNSLEVVFNVFKDSDYKIYKQLLG